MSVFVVADNEGVRNAALVVAIFSPLALMMALVIWLGLQRRPVPPGYCPCGYSLAGLAPGARYPECGARPSEASGR